MFPLDDTIAAIASPPGGAARGIIRLSGPRAIECVGQFFQPDDRQPLTSRRFPCAVAGSLRLPELHSPLPCDLYLWGEPRRGEAVECWGGSCTATPALEATVQLSPQHDEAGETPAPQVHSYTGQPVAEIHTLGSPPLLDLVLRTLCAAGDRLAGPGEFTLRAFLAGRIDLTQAEAVLGVIDAADRQELSVALGQLAGGLARPLHRLREALLDLLAHLEAGFDFADEDLSFLPRDELNQRLARAEEEVTAMLRQMASRGEARHEARAVLVGRPNTGKSSLFNALAGQCALVSDQPGTTRDYLVAELDLDGVKCQLIDTAGMRGEISEERGERREEREESSNIHDVDAAAEHVADQQHGTADVRVLCLDSTRPLDDWERGQLQADGGEPRVVALTKCDAPRAIDCDCVAVETSSVTRQGLDTLVRELRRSTLAARGDRGEVVADTAVRCRESLRLAGECLGRARCEAAAGQEELVAAELRAALHELGTVAGAVYTDDVLDRIFSRFCIGK